jgi:hypothetical protein
MEKDVSLVRWLVPASVDVDGLPAGLVDALVERYRAEGLAEVCASV